MKSIPSLVRLPFKYGSSGGVLIVVLFVVILLLGRQFFLLPIYLDIRILLLPLFLVFAQLEYKRYFNNGFLHFWEGVLIGVQVLVWMAGIAALGIVIIGSFQPEVLNDYISTVQQQIFENRPFLDEQLGQEVVDEQLAKLPLTTIGDLALDYFWKTMGIGLVLNLIIAIILRKQNLKT